MSTKSINFRVEEDLKINAEELLSEMGLTMSSALTLFLKQMVNRRALPFLVEASYPVYSEANQELLESRLAKYEEGFKVQRELIEVD